MSSQHPRMKRERKTIQLMIELYCQDHHDQQGSTLCSDCEELYKYAIVRLQNCPFQENKTTCGNCPIHCYKPTMREKVREIMRYSGPRMLFHHPLLAIGHTIDGFRKTPRKAKQ